jgi:hypothetical protein
LLDASEVGGGKIHVGVLAELNELLAPCGTVPDPRPILAGALEITQYGEVIEPPGLCFKIMQEGHECLAVD